MSLTTSRSPFKVAVLLFALLVLPLSWLAIPYVFDGKELLGDAGRERKTAQIREAQALAGSLARIYIAPTGEEMMATFVTEAYLQRNAGSANELLYSPEEYLIFLLSETVHTGRLPLSLPEVVLLRPDNANFKPVHIEGPSDVDHHRVTYVYFKKTTPNGESVLPGDGSPFRLVMENEGPERRHYVGWFEWTYPMPVPDDSSGAVEYAPVFVATLALGLLAATLTPCMLQMSVMYTAMLAGTAAGERQHLRGRAMAFALAFVAGFVLLFSLVGGLIGWSGQYMHIALSLYSRQIATVSGVAVLAFGILLAYRARMPVVCKLPLGWLHRAIDTQSVWANAFLAIGFAIGCTSCFGGAIIGTLVIYVGVLESPLVGAGLMAVFAFCVGLPFLLAAVLVGRSEVLLETLMRWQKPVQYFAAATVIFFGVVLITDNYHTLSDIIYEFLPLMP